MKPKVISTIDGVVKFKSHFIQCTCCDCGKESEVFHITNDEDYEQDLEIELKRIEMKYLCSECLHGM